MDLNSLNDMQHKAVLHTNGPLLILAGAGSGKTRVLTYRIANLIKSHNVNPWSILAITFTNKAAAEMKERISQLVGENTTRDMWVSTFHSMCVKILRSHGDKIGYDRYFTIYDTQDQKSLIKDILKILNKNDKDFPIGNIMSAISNNKNQFILPKEARENAKGNYRDEILAEIYDMYQDKLYENNAMDFDDLLVNTCILLTNHDEVLEFYRNKFRYILVDEYQDTNMVQYKLIKLLVNSHNNLCVVGDDDQSIYGWRGADIRNILDFEKDFNNVEIIKLEQNYRSTQNILKAANQVIANNLGRKSKSLWTENKKGDQISVINVDNEYREADKIAEIITDKITDDKKDYKDFAVLYRTNAQSRVLEEKMINNSIPYRLLGGIRFYERKEIKDLIAYLRTISNNRDDVALKRIINVPKRGIGAASITKIEGFAAQYRMDFFEVTRHVKEMSILSNASAQKVLLFTGLIEELREIAMKNDVYLLLAKVIEKTEYIAYIKDAYSEDADERIENINELISKAMSYMKNAEEPSLDQFLEEVALVADVDNYDQESNSVILMTLHSAKGLEFPVVFLPGLEEGLFPSFRSKDNEEQLEEERRLCYVGITRAREKLYILHTTERTLYGQTNLVAHSRFINELPNEIVEIEKNTRGYNHFATTKVAKSSFNNSTKNKNSFSQNSFNKSKFTNTIPSKIENLPKINNEFSEGDVVKHKLFGKGTITEISKTSEDIFVTIHFNDGSKKKLSTRFAKLQKL